MLYHKQEPIARATYAEYSIAAYSSSESTVTIDGSALSSRISVSGNNNQRVFNVNNNATVTLRSLTIINGNASDGAGIIVESGSTLNLVNCLLNGNVPGNFGGGVYNTGNLRINGYNITNNHASWGGGVENRQTLTVVDSTFMNNITSNGGAGVEVYGGTATIARSGFINNVSFNGRNTGSGGGFQSDPGTGDVQLTNDTFSGNQARAGSDDGGGSIMSYGGNLYLSNTTLVNNYSATHGGGISTNAGYATAINLNNTIIYNNSYQFCGHLFHRPLCNLERPGTQSRTLVLSRRIDHL